MPPADPELGKAIAYAQKLLDAAIGVVGAAPWHVELNQNWARDPKIVFGEWAIVPEWGRRGSPGTVRLSHYRRRDEAQIAEACTIKRRLQRGYAEYQKAKREQAKGASRLASALLQVVLGNSYAGPLRAGQYWSIRRLLENGA